MSTEAFGDNFDELISMDESLNDRVRERRRSMIARVARSADAAERISEELDEALLPSGRVEAIWPLTCQLYAMRGMDAAQFRLNRSVARIERRGR